MQYIGWKGLVYPMYFKSDIDKCQIYCPFTIIYMKNCIPFSIENRGQHMDVFIVITKYPTLYAFTKN